MYKNNTFFKNVSDKAVVIYLHGYGGNKKELPFLRNFIVKKKKISFFSFSYVSPDVNKKRPLTKYIAREIERTIKIFLSSRHFKKYYLIGYSLGAALALAITPKALAKFDKLILISIFDDRKDLLKNRGINISDNENISPALLIKKNKKTPTIFIHGAFDSSISMERGLRVYNNSRNKKNEFIPLPVGHYFNNDRAKKLLLESIKNLL